MKSKRAGTAHAQASSDGEDVPALPVWKAFVVQFSRETGAQTGVFAGRVEHMSSGRRARFRSSEQLIAELRTMLDQLGENGS
jgi:hypothetical protein